MKDRRREIQKEEKRKIEIKVRYNMEKDKDSQREGVEFGKERLKSGI